MNSADENMNEQEDHQRHRTSEKTPRKISIVLPRSTTRSFQSTRNTTSLLRHNASIPETNKITPKLHKMSVTSYVVQHSPRKSRGNFVPHLWNDLTPSMSINTIKDMRMAPSGWCIGGGSQKMANVITEQLDAVREDHDVAFPRIHVDEDIDDTRSNASTPSCSSTITQLSSPSFSSGTPKQMGSTMLTPFPIVKFQRPPVAVKKGLIYYSDLPLLRKQMGLIYSAREKEKFRRDFVRTTNDIYRLKLNRPESARGGFREMCATYLSTSPGATRAITGQLC